MYAILPGGAHRPSPEERSGVPGQRRINTMSMRREGAVRDSVHQAGTG